MQCSAYFASSTRWRSWPSFSCTVVEFSLSTLVKLLWRHSSVAKQNNGWKEMKGYERKNGTKQIRPRSYRIKKDQTRSTMWNFVASHCSSLFRFVVRCVNPAQVKLVFSSIVKRTLWMWLLSVSLTWLFRHDYNIAWYAEPSACAIQWNYHSPSLTLAETHANTNNELVDLICRHAITYKYHVVPFVAEVECRAKQGNRWQSQGSCLCC